MGDIAHAQITSFSFFLYKRAKMVLGRLPEYLRGPDVFFSGSFKEKEFYFKEFLFCPYRACKPHSPEPCFSTDQNFANKF